MFVPDTIEEDVLRRLDRRVVVCVVVALAGLVVTVVGLAAGLGKSWSAGVAAVVATVGLTCAIGGCGFLVNALMVRSVGRRYGWRTMACEVIEVGVGKARRVEVRLPALHRRLKPSDGLSNSQRLVGLTEVDVAGGGTGRVLLRAPGTTKLAVFNDA